MPGARSPYRDHMKSGGRLPVEVWADKQLASEQKMGRELGPWAEKQDRAGRERELENPGAGF